MMSDHHIFVTILVLVLIYILWMDLALYYKLQSGYNELMVVQNYQELQPASAATVNASAAAPAGAGQAYYDPFDPISVKLLMLDHLNHYIFYPMCWWLDTNLLHISDRLLFITPDMISLSHVAVALLGSRCVISESLSQRRLGVLLFQLRSMLDSYDGMVARARHNTRGMAQVSGNWGYYMDGICDTIGTVFFFFACWVLLRRHQPRRHASEYDLQPLIPGSSGSGVGGSSSSSSSSALASTSLEEGEPFILPSQKTPRLFTLSTVTIMCLLLQQFFGSVFWNRYMQEYHTLLEIPVSPSEETFQVNTLKSSPFWIISWSWKLINPHSHMSILLCFVFFDCAVSVFTWLRYLGFIPLAFLTLSSEIHYQTMAWHFWIN